MRYLQALEMRCFLKFLGISYRDNITNEKVKARIGNAIGSYEELLTSVKRRKLKWYGHVTRSSGLAKTILQGTVQGGRRRGRQRKRWEDNIKEWTGLEWVEYHTTESREPRGVGEAGCKIYSGAPTVSQTTGQVKIKKSPGHNLYHSHHSPLCKRPPRWPSG